MNRLFAIISFFAVLAISCQPAAETTKAEHSAITEAVYASAVVHAMGQFELRSEVGGRIDRFYFEEGELVPMDSILVDIHSEQADLAVANARSRYDLARKQYRSDAARYAELKAQIDLSERRVRLDSVDLARKERLMKQDIGTRAALDQARFSYEASLKEWESLQNRLLDLQDQNEANYLSALSSLELEESRADEFRIRLHSDFRLYERYIETGESVRPGAAIALLGAADSFYVEMEVDEQDIRKLEKGQRVILSLEAFPDEVHEGRVSRIYPVMSPQTQTFRVDAQFLKAPSGLYPRLTAEANIIIREKEEALVIPAEYLLSGNRVLSADGKDTIVVETGIRTLDHVEIRSGLDPSISIRKP